MRALQVEDYLASDDWLAESTVQLPSAPTAAPSGNPAASPSNSRRTQEDMDRMLFSGIEVQTTSPAKERSKQEEDDLINKLTAELHVDASKQKQGDAQVDVMRSRLDKLKEVRLGSSSASPSTKRSQQQSDAEAQRSAAPRPLGPPPILDPYEFELAASESDLDSSDDDNSSTSSKSADSEASEGKDAAGEKR